MLTSKKNSIKIEIKFYLINYYKTLCILIISYFLINSY